MRELTRREIERGVFPHPLGWNAVILASVFLLPILILTYLFGIIGFGLSLIIVAGIGIVLPEETFGTVSGNEVVAVQNRLTWLWKEPKDKNGMSVFRFYNDGTMVLLPFVHKIQTRFELDHENTIPFSFTAEIEGVEIEIKGKGVTKPNEDRLQDFLSTDATRNGSGSDEKRNDKLREFFEEDLPTFIGDTIRDKTLDEVRGRLSYWNNVVTNLFLGNVPRNSNGRVPVNRIATLAHRAKELADNRGVIVECKIGNINLPEDLKKKYSAKASADYIARGAYVYFINQIGAQEVESDPDPTYPRLEYDKTPESMKLVWQKYCKHIRETIKPEKKALEEIERLWNQVKDDSKEDVDEFNRVVHHVKGISKEQTSIMLQGGNQNQQ